MTRTIRRALTGAVALGVAGALSATAIAASSATDRDDDRDLKVVGLTSDQRLVRFDSDSPRRTRDIGDISGLIADTSLVGIDYRVQDGKLYGVGNAGGVYTLSSSDASASKVSQLSMPLSGMFFGVDFNPAADRLRVVSDNGQNLRHDVNPGGVTTADTTLTFPPATTPAAGVAAAAYTNNDLDARTGTTLFDIDTMMDRVAIQSPANSGQLVPTGSLGMDAGPNVGADIYSAVRSGVTVDNQGLATVQVAGNFRLIEIDPLTGTARDQGAFPSRSQVTDIAIQLNQR